jgi:hypothetical protein
MKGTIRSAFAVHCCGPLEYVLRLLCAIAVSAALLAGLLRPPLLPLVQYRVPGLMTWPESARLAAVAFLAVLAVWDVALLRLRRRGAQS